MALKLSKPQQEVLAMAIRAVLTATYPTFTKRQERSLKIVYDKLQNERVGQVRPGSRRSLLTVREAKNMLAQAAQEQAVWLNQLNP